ncbi:MAG TPA: hypothetical protein VN673_12720 [Clostridia bacterium]|nr:hypothetical protein [Clostridia bacterium]
MKRIAPNAWRAELNENDWHFEPLCPSSEVKDCLHWELLREKVQAEAGGTLPSSPLASPPSAEALRIARFWTVGSLNKHLTAISRNKAQKEPAWCQEALRILKVPKGWIFHPHFPQCSYLDHRKKQRWEPLTKEEPARWIWLDIDWGDYFFDNWENLYDIVRTTPRKPLWIGGDEAQFELCPLSIPWGWRDEDIVKAFREWLKQNRPRGEEWDERPCVNEPPPEPKKKGGAGDPIRQAKVSLKALAAWRLIQHYSGSDSMALSHPGAEKYLGKAFNHPSEWTSARKRVCAALQEWAAERKKLLDWAGANTPLGQDCIQSIQELERLCNHIMGRALLSSIRVS